MIPPASNPVRSNAPRAALASAVLLLGALLPVGCATTYRPPEDWTVHSRSDQQLRASSGDGLRMLMRRYTTSANKSASDVGQELIQQASRKGWLVLEERPLPSPSSDLQSFEVLMEEMRPGAAGIETLWLTRIVVRPAAEGSDVAVAEVLGRGPILRHHREALNTGFGQLLP